MQPRQNGCVDLVGFDLGLCDEAHLARIGYDHSADMGAQPLRHRDGIARGLQHHLIIRLQLSRKGINMGCVISTRPPRLITPSLSTATSAKVR